MDRLSSSTFLVLVLLAAACGKLPCDHRLRDNALFQSLFRHCRPLSGEMSNRKDVDIQKDPSTEFSDEFDYLLKRLDALVQDEPTQETPLPTTEEPISTTPQCPGLMEYNECGSACPPTCEIPYPLKCTLPCVQGCFCPTGYVELDGKCIKPKECPSSIICKLPSDTGPCRAAFKRYFHNATTGSCEEFIYGGCQGNGNNFVTLEECIETCVVERPSLIKGQAWISERCNSLIISTFDARTGVFKGIYRSLRGGAGVRFFVSGSYNAEGNTIAFAVSWKNRFVNYKSVSAFSGHARYLADGDPIIETTYLLSRKGGKMEVGFEKFYSAEHPQVPCPRQSFIA